MTNVSLERNHPGVEGPLLLIIMDGVGIYRGKSEGYPGNALDLANAPTLKALLHTAPVHAQLKAHGTAVGLPDDSDMGNSEVGHNAMGAGRIFDQGAKLVSSAIKSGDIFNSPVWQKLIGRPDRPGLALEKGKNRSVHFIGLLSDGNVHSHIDHLLALLDRCAHVGVKRVFVHALLDGRDVDEKSAHIYLAQLENKLAELDPSRKNYRIASGGGRMVITMDRYEADWKMVEKGWETHVAGNGRYFPDALTAVKTLRAENPACIDQDIPPFVIAEDGNPVGPIREDDIVVLYNFRGDRAIEISRAFVERDFPPFTRVPNIHTHYAGMMEYDGDLKLPPEYLVVRSLIQRTVSEYLVSAGVRQYAISETQKFGHVTYFWNGNNSEPFDRNIETWVEIPSDHVSFDKAPAMKAREITDALIPALQSGDYRFLRVNFANGDMVGHTGSLQAAIQAVEAVDQSIARLMEAAQSCNATIIITADHGNCDQMISVDKKGNVQLSQEGHAVPKTSHTLSPVPFLIVGGNSDRIQLNNDLQDPGIAQIAPTILTLLGYKLPDDYLPSLVQWVD